MRRHVVVEHRSLPYHRVARGGLLHALLLGDAAALDRKTGMASSYTRAMAKAAKVMISLPPDLLERLDRAARERGTSRSAFLQGVVRRELGWPDPAAFDAALDRGRRALAAAGAFESAELIREERDARDERDRHR
jgi:predicted transcriptional regulator